MHAVRTSMKYNEIMKTARKGSTLTAVSTVKLEPWSTKKCSDKDALVEKSGRRNSRFNIFKYYMFITMCQLMSSSYIQPKCNGTNPLELDSTHYI